MVEERNENNEIVRQIVEKSRKRKVTALKKAILKKREKLTQRVKSDIPKPVKDELSSGYVTIDETHEDGTTVIVTDKSPVKLPVELIQTRGLPYAALFRDLEGICSKVEDEMLKPYNLKIDEHLKKDSTEKSYVKFSMIKEDDTTTADEVNTSLQFSLHPKKFIREYVDVVQNQDLEQCVFSLVQKLKKLYFNRKVNPNNKKGKLARNLKKRYIVGMK